MRAIRVKICRGGRSHVTSRGRGDHESETGERHKAHVTLDCQPPLCRAPRVPWALPCRDDMEVVLSCQLLSKDVRLPRSEWRFAEDPVTPVEVSAATITARSVIVHVTCGAITLKLTLTAKVLAKSLREGCIEPFLSVVNKKRASSLTPLTAQGLERVEIDGVAIDAMPCIGLPANSIDSLGVALLPRRSHRVELFLPRSWCPQPIEGKGIGLIATRAIAPGERILQEKPLLMCVSVAGGQLDTNELAQAVAQLDEGAQAAFYGLSHCAEAWGERATPIGIWRSNAYPTHDLADGRREAAIFADISRINHSCVPNAHIGWSETLEQQTVQAIRHIQPDEEILVSYLEYGHGRDERRGMLRHKFGFDCACSLCSLRRADVEASDVRQRRLLQIDAELANATQVPKLQLRLVHTFVELVSEKIRVLMTEGLPTSWAHKDMVSAFFRCRQVGEMNAATSWLQRALVATTLLVGEDSKEFKGLKAISKEES